VLDLSLLPNRLKKHNSNGRGQIQTSCARHWDGNAPRLVRPQQVLRQSLRFPPENQEIAGAESNIPVSALCLGRYEKTALARLLGLD
jgi:hypothetical protein